MRPSPMRAGTTILSVLILLALAGCGDAVRTDPVSPAQWRDCTMSTFDRAPGQPVDASTGDGRFTVKIVPEDRGPCGGGLVVEGGPGVRGVDVRPLDLDASTARTVHLGDQVLVLVLGGHHPRGGYQPHLFAVTDAVGEVVTDAGPVLPFVATDGGGTPTTARCRRDGRLVVLTAATSKPPGIVLAWDVTRTTYEVDGTRAVATGSEQVRDHAADPVLREDMPDLFEPGALLAGCAR